MKRILTYLSIILSLSLFSIFNIIRGKAFSVVKIYTPTSIAVDFNHNGIAENNENVCIADIEAFSLDISDEFYNKYAKSLNLTRKDMMALGYLATDYSQKALENKRVKVKYTKKFNSDCKFAKIIVDNADYSKLLLNSGFGIKDNKIGNIVKYKKNLDIAKKLNLVIFNHHSHKYHTLDCEFGKQAHDYVILPKRQLPPEAKPCQYCHLNFNTKNKIKKHTYFNTNENLNIKQPVLTITDGDISLFHTDFTKQLKPDSKCNSNVCKIFVKHIEKSKKSIDIAIYGYEDIPQITKALYSAKSRGVKIRFVYDEAINPDNTFYKGNNVIANIAEASKSDRFCEGAKLMHNKFIIFDNKTVFTGSMNFSPSGASGYDVNDVVIINSNDIAELYTKEFEQMLNGKFHNTKQKHNTPNKFKLGDSVVEIYFSPQDKQVTRMVEIINSAKKYIYVPTYLITHKNIANALINAHNRGIEVKIILDANSVTTQNSKHKLLRDSKISLKTENYAGKLHSKGMVIDDSYLILGSMNFSNSGENKNDENLIIIQNYTLASNYKSFFNYLWRVIPDKYLKFNPPAEGKESIGSCSDGVDNNFNGKSDTEEELCK